MPKRIITTDQMEEDSRLEPGLRPQRLKDYIGQEKAKNTLNIYIELVRNTLIRSHSELIVSSPYTDLCGRYPWTEV